MKAMKAMVKGGAVFALAASLALSLALTVAASLARGEEGSALAGGLSQDRIHLRAGFTGAELLIFGALDQGDRFSETSAIIITLTGPARDMGLWKKAPVAGVWTNYRWRRFPDIPSFYALASTRRVSEILESAERRRLQIGAESFLPAPSDDFARALLRLMRKSGAYPSRAEQVVFLGQRLFRATFHIPPSAPLGLYRAKIHLFEAGRLLDTRAFSLQVNATGVAAWVSHFAWHYPLLYGFAAALIGLALGGAAFLLMRRR